MSGNYPDGVRQQDIDRLLDGDEPEEEEIETVEEKLSAQLDKAMAQIDKLRLYNNRLKGEVCKYCPTCVEYEGKMCPTHFGSEQCESGSIASGGTKSHCTCDWCF